MKKFRYTREKGYLRNNAKDELTNENQNKNPKKT